MKLIGSQNIAAEPEKVWAALNDPTVLQRSIPGCQSLEKSGDDSFAAIVEIKIGPIGARFNGGVSLTDLDPPKSYTLVGEGRGGMAGNARGKALVRLAPAANGTLLTYEVEAEVGGRLAQLGGPVIDATAKQLAARFFSTFEQQVTGVSKASHADDGEAPHSTPIAPVARPGGLKANTTAPWAWLIVVMLAIVAGFLLGRSDASGWWVVAMLVLALASAGAGYQAGRGAGS